VCRRNRPRVLVRHIRDVCHGVLFPTGGQPLRSKGGTRGSLREPSSLLLERLPRQKSGLTLTQRSISVREYSAKPSRHRKPLWTVS
jgi:hypothetical protein